MMQTIRANLLGLIPWRRIATFAGWSGAIMFVGLLTGVMAVVLPPLASIGVVALAGVTLLWALPEMRVVPDKLLRKMFFAMVAVQLCIPVYYAIDTGYLPWISVKRLFSLTVILLFALTVAGSQAARDKIADTVRSNRLLAFLSFGFLAMLIVSVLTAANPVQSFSGLIDAVLTWYLPLFACILIVRTEKDVILLLKIIAIAGIVDSLLGVIEFFLQRLYYFDIFPQSVLEAMLASNPGLEIIYTTPQFRNGIYRASSIYTTPLSFGELAAMAGPVGAYFFFHSETMKWRLMGMISVTASAAALLVSGARGGLIAFLIAMPIMLLLWTVRYSRANPASMVGTIMGAIFSMGILAVLGLIALSNRLFNMIFGGGEALGSTDARFVQFEMAVPHILSNPITGYGKGAAAPLVGYFNPGNPIPTIDSYVITLLVEQGVPGLLLFFGMIGLGIWTGVRLYLTNANQRAAVGGPIACCLIAFAVYRPVLSETENHTLFFLVIGLVFAISRIDRGALFGKRHGQFQAPFASPRL